jgi:hypothetical protein
MYTYVVICDLNYHKHSNMCNNICHNPHFDIVCVSFDELQMYAFVEWRKCLYCYVMSLRGSRKLIRHVVDLWKEVSILN